MRAADLRRLLAMELPSLSRRERVVAACRTVSDYERIARRRLPRAIADYVDGGADDELSLRWNTEAIRKRRFTPATVGDVSSTDTSVELFGTRLTAPFGFAPTGYTKMISVDGETAVASAAAQLGIPYVLSTMSSTSLEDVRAAVPQAELWFQLYLWRDRTIVRDLIARAREHGYRALEVAVDTPVAGNRLRDARNGLAIPPRIRAKALVDIVSRPAYWTRLVSRPMMTFANFDRTSGGAWNTIEMISAQFDDTIGWHDLEWIRELWDGPLVLKGPVGPAEAVRAAALGYDGVHLSNHGGRQLDRTVAPIDLVAPVRAAVGAEPTVIVDSGFRTGADVVTAIASGADAAFVGRPYLWGLVAGGSAGVHDVGSILTGEVERTMKLLGADSTAELRDNGTRYLAGGSRARSMTDVRVEVG